MGQIISENIMVVASSDESAARIMEIIKGNIKSQNGEVELLDFQNLRKEMKRQEKGNLVFVISNLNDAYRGLPRDKRPYLVDILKHGGVVARVTRLEYDIVNDLGDYFGMTITATVRQRRNLSGEVLC